MNQNLKPLLAYNAIDKQLFACGWVIQDRKPFDFIEKSVAIRGFQASVGSAGYVLFVHGETVGLIEAKQETECVCLAIAEDQSKEYAGARLKYIVNGRPPFGYESIRDVTLHVD